MAKAPDPRALASQQRAEHWRNLRWIVSVDGKEHTFRLGDVTAVDNGDLRREAQLRITEMTTLAAQGEFDAVAAIVWLARRQAGEVNLRYGDVAAEFTVDRDVWIRNEDEPEPAEEFPDPPV